MTDSDSNDNVQQKVTKKKVTKTFKNNVLQWIEVDDKIRNIRSKVKELTTEKKPPLADRFYYTNSVANVNRNASHDLRGDISIPYNETYTPFYQSAIYGEPLTVNRLGDKK